MKKRKMTNDELVNEINWFCKDADPQDDGNIQQLYFHYYKMFQDYCGKIPEFDVDPKGQITLTGRVQKK